MALRNILNEEDPLLRKVSRPVTEFNDRLHVLLDDMKETLLLAEGAGLAAPQVGILRRVAVVNVDDEYIELVNPEITEMKGEETGPEGCLSIPGVCGNVSRPHQVKVKALDRYGKPFEVSGKALLARAFCHEIDHLDGILFTDKMIDIYDVDED